MLGLFQELGPCRINNQSTGVDLNPMSWNNRANLYDAVPPRPELLPV
jgi:carboxypeptidase C (cathepsin A)